MLVGTDTTKKGVGGAPTHRFRLFDFRQIELYLAFRLNDTDKRGSLDISFLFATNCVDYTMVPFLRTILAFIFSYIRFVRRTHLFASQSVYLKSAHSNDSQTVAYFIECISKKRSTAAKNSEPIAITPSLLFYNRISFRCSGWCTDLIVCLVLFLILLV